MIASNPHDIARIFHIFPLKTPRTQPFYPFSTPHRQGQALRGGLQGAPKSGRGRGGDFARGSKGVRMLECAYIITCI